MAKIIGNPPFVGTVGNLTIYEQDGQYIARMKADYGKKEIMRNPNCIRQRENMTSFGHSSHVGGMIRKAWRQIGNIAMDKTTCYRLSPILYDMEKRGAGIRGSQSIEISKFGAKLKGFTLGKDRSPAAHFTHSPEWQLSGCTETQKETLQKLGREAKEQQTIPTILQLTFPEKTRHSARRIPAKAKYYKIYLHATAISDYHSEEKYGDFIPTHGEDDIIAAHIKSDFYSIGENPGANGTLELELPQNAIAGHNLIITWGIEYFAEENGQPIQIIISKPRSKCRQTETYCEVLAVTQLQAFQPAQIMQTEEEITARAQAEMQEWEEPESDETEAMCYLEPITIGFPAKQPQRIKPKTTHTAPSVRPGNRRSRRKRERLKQR